MQVEACNPLKPVRQIYEEIVNSDRGPNRCVMTPRNYKQVFS